jgi:hypothetical protein
VINIGVTGHRFLAEVDKLQAGIDQALAWIERIMPGEQWSLISSLAEGADRLVTRQVLRRKPGVKLLVPLPLPTEEYRKDFSSEESNREFLHLLGLAGEIIQPTPALTREDGYLAAGQYLLDHSNVLITLWDGQTAQGKGGTGEIIPMAIKRGIPVAWVHCGNRKPGTHEPVSLGDEQGQVSFNFL